MKTKGLQVELFIDGQPVPVFISIDGKAYVTLAGIRGVSPGLAMSCKVVRAVYMYIEIEACEVSSLILAATNYKEDKDGSGN
jgi:hypothetical protein